MELLPRKLLDAEVVDGLPWPETGWTALGDVIRLDYTTALHHEGMWTPYYHDFHSGVQALGERIDDEEIEAPLHRSVDPIVMGLVDRVYVRTGDRLLVAFREGDEGLGGPEPDERVMLPPTVLAWDPEHKALLFLDQGDARPWLALSGGALRLDDEAMIGG